MEYIFISPHLDDLILSACDFIIYLKKHNNKIKVITIFTDFGKGPLSLDARKYLIKSNCLLLRNFAKKRKNEDKKAMKLLEINNFIYLDFVDAAFRLNEKGPLSQKIYSLLGIGNRFLYPKFNKQSLYSKKISKEDSLLSIEIFNKLSKHVSQKSILCLPIAQKTHIDHVITNIVGNKFNNKKLFWLDQPYNKKSKKFKKYKLSTNFSISNTKYKAVSLYKSQVKQLFPEGIKLTKEQIYEKN